MEVGGVYYLYYSNYQIEYAQIFSLLMKDEDFSYPEYWAKENNSEYPELFLKVELGQS